MYRFTAFFGVAVVGIGASAMGAVIYPANNGFELVDQGSGSSAYEYDVVPGWTVAQHGSGEAANGSAFQVVGATNGNSDGTTSAAGQAALMQGGDGTLAGISITQSIMAPAGTTSLQIVYSAENRDNTSTGPFNEQVKVYLDGILVDTQTPATGGFTNYATSTVAASAGPHTIGFAGLHGTGSDTTVFVDNVSVSAATPEPASLGLLALGGLGLLARSRRLK